MSSQLHQLVVGLRTTIAEELPRVSHLTDLVEVELGGDQLRLVTRCGGEELPARIAEVTLPVELADVPRLLVSDAIDRADEIRVRDCVSWLLELPQILRQSRDGR